MRVGRKPTRRQVLAGLGASGAVIVGGAVCCLGRRGAVPAPTVRDDRLGDEWERVSRSQGAIFEESVGPLRLRAFEHTLVYERTGPDDEFVEAGDEMGSPVLFFAARVDIRPGVDLLPFGVGRREVMNEVRPTVRTTFREQLIAARLTDVRVASERTITVRSRYDATLIEYTANYRGEWDVPLEDGTTETVRVTVPFGGLVVVWHDGTDILLGGGAFPSESLVDVIARGLPQDASLDEEFENHDALNTSPEEYAREIRTLTLAIK